MNIWFTADTHMGHGNIIKYCHRPFTDAKHMDDTIIANWNGVVRSGDIVYHLGDFAFCKTPQDVDGYIKRLNGQIHLILGNHDKHTVTDAKGFAWMGKKYQSKMVKIGEQYVFMSHYACRVWDHSHHGAWGLFGHSHNTLPDDPNSLSCDVGQDAWKFTPVSFEEIKAVMAKKNFKPIDHHRNKEDVP